MIEKNVVYRNIRYMHLKVTHLGQFFIKALFQYYNYEAQLRQKRIVYEVRKTFFYLLLAIYKTI